MNDSMAGWMKEGREGASEQAKKEASKERSSMDAMRRVWVYAAADPDLQIKRGGGVIQAVR